MILSKSAQTSLDFIRLKVTKQLYDFNALEKNALSEVYSEIQLFATGKKVVLNIGCAGCVVSAINVCKNYITFHEPVRVEQVKKADTPANVQRIVYAPIDTTELSLSELRVMHPHIKATSVKVFLQKLEDEKAI